MERFQFNEEWETATNIKRICCNIGLDHPVVAWPQVIEAVGSDRIGRRITNNRRNTAVNTLELDGNVCNWFALVVLASSGECTVLAVDKVIVNDGDISKKYLLRLLTRALQRAKEQRHTQQSSITD